MHFLTDKLFPVEVFLIDMIPHFYKIYSNPSVTIEICSKIVHWN